MSGRFKVIPAIRRNTSASMGDLLPEARQRSDSEGAQGAQGLRKILVEWKKLYYDAVQLRLQNNYEGALVILRRAQRLNPMSRDLKVLIKDSEEKLDEMRRANFRRKAGLLMVVQRMMGMKKDDGPDRPDSRSAVWRQEAPPFMTSSPRASVDVVSGSPLFDPTRHAKGELKRIMADYDAKKYDSCRYRCEQVLVRLKDIKAHEMKDYDKQVFVANVHSILGNACLELQRFEEAIDAHLNDLLLSRQYYRKTSIARALFNMGRCYARTCRFQEAIDVWEERISMTPDDCERAWLEHEIGRCYLALHNNEKARDYATSACANAQEVPQLHVEAAMLLGSANERLGLFDEAITAYNQAFEIANELDDDQLLVEIQEAIDRLEAKLLSLLSKGGLSEEETASVNIVNESPQPPSTASSGHVTSRDILLEENDRKCKMDNFYMVMLYLVHAMAD